MCNNTLRANIFAWVIASSIVFLPAPCASQVPLSAYTNFEGAQTNPIRLSADGARLYALNTADARLSVFSLAQPSSPSLIAEIPVGLEPVSLFPVTDDEVWVVNQVSDSVSIVSVSKGIVVDTIYVKDDPADVLILGDLAFVSVAGSNELRAFSVATHHLAGKIPLQGHAPRALARSPNGEKLYVLFTKSGNHTTIIPTGLAPPQPPPTNPQLPPPPRVSLIVDAYDPQWSSVVTYRMPDDDVAVVDVATLAVAGYFHHVGTLNMGIAVRPTTGDLYVSNTQARNLIRFEPELRGHWVDNRITRVQLSGQVAPFNLNPGVDYSVLPNPEALATALAQPTALVFQPDGKFFYLAAFGTDRVARVGANGNVLSFIEIGPATGSTADPQHKRGPRGLALNASTNRLYVLNRISDTISVVDTSTNTVLKEIPVGYDPTPAEVRNGRGFLYDAKLSGNGTGACASCHLDADMDHLAWDLGDPGGDLQVVTSGGKQYTMHPMKGPMVTQTLRGLRNLQPYHWRGDKADFAAFNGAFDSLMGGSPLSDAGMTAYTHFIDTLRFPPNPNQNLDQTLPASLNGADPNSGLNTYLNEFAAGTTTCNDCHTANPGPGTNRLIVQRDTAPQPIKVPQLRNMYQKVFFNKKAGADSIDGFGFGSPGEFATLIELLNRPSAFPNFAGNLPLIANLSAYVLCFDTGTAPAVGYTRTIRPANLLDGSVQADWALLESQAAANNIALIAKGTIGGKVHGLYYLAANNTYISDSRALGSFTHAQLAAFIQAGDILSFMGVPPGSGVRMGIDRNLDGVLDGDQ